MKKHLNTLYITTQGTYLHKERETIAVRVEGKDKAKLPIHNIESIVCFGNVTCSPFLLGHCAENNVSVSFLTEYGRFLGKVSGPVNGNVLLRREQYRWADDAQKSLDVAKFILTGKIINSRNVLRRFIRDNKNSKEIEQVKRIEVSIQKEFNNLHTISCMEELRGLEGLVANKYFSVFNHMILQNKADFNFSSRNRRPPLDRINALLSFLYVMVMHDIRSALETVGLDPAVGFLHRDRPGRYGLALDMMEEFRSFFTDRLVLSLVNLKKVNSGHFRVTDSGAVLLNDEGKKIVLTSFQEKKDEEIYHPYIEEKCKYGRLFHIQAMLMARWIRGDIKGYPPFFWK
jgi:CRISPR-associated protein Cas1